MKPRLLSISGPLAGTTFPLNDGEVSLGRDASSQIFISDHSVSRHHCLIKNESGTFRLIDLESFNGTFVNGVPVAERVLCHGDRVTLGDVLFLFLLEEEDEGKTTAGATQLDDQLIARTTIRLERENAFYLDPQKIFEALPPSARLAQDLNALLKISTRLNTFRDSENLQRHLLDVVMAAVPAERGALLFVRDKLEDITSALEKDWKPATDQPLRVSRTVAEQVFREGVAVLGKDLTRNPAFGEAESLLSSKVSSVLCVPLFLGERVAGLIYLDTGNSLAPFDESHLQLLTAIAGIASVALENVTQLEWLRGENQRLQQEINIEHEMIGESVPMRDVYQIIGKVAVTDATVLILGESGTGKELAARAIHTNSERARKPFIAINCAALTETLLESELFGHEKGAFTGAVAQKRGKFELADGGTIFLDEVGEIAHSVQAKLLRVLQEREFERVGGTRTIKADVRVVSATNKNLEEAIKNGGFRQDLYYRLKVISLRMPPLRERREDISLLANYFTVKYSQKCKRHILGITPEARASLLSYEWPGNVRELENTIERAIVLGVTELITLEDLPEAVIESNSSKRAPANFYAEVREVKRNLILKVINQAGGNYTRAAEILGIHPANLHRLIRTMDLKTSLRKPDHL